MNQAVKQLIKHDPQKTASVALKTFFNIMQKWGVKNEIQMNLLGGPSKATFFKWKKDDVSGLPRDTLERISYVMGIYKALGMLFPTREQADAWPNKANAEFNDLSALNYMDKGSILQLIQVRRYLDAQRG